MYMGWDDICRNQEAYKPGQVYFKANIQMSNMYDPLVGNIILFLFRKTPYNYKLAKYNCCGSRTLCSVYMPLNLERSSNDIL